MVLRQNDKQNQSLVLADIIPIHIAKDGRQAIKHKKDNPSDFVSDINLGNGR